MRAAPYGSAVRTSNKDSFLGGKSTSLCFWRGLTYGKDRHAPGKTYWPFYTVTKTVSSRWDQ